MSYSINIDSEHIKEMDLHAIEELKNIAVSLIVDCTNAIANKKEHKE